jgi:hypothetical protein
MPEEEKQHDSRPYFVIPYWSSSGPGDSGDNGDTRPLPGNIISYLCPSIQTSPFSPGERLDVKVEVANFGGSNVPSQAQVTVWWADPTTGFVVSPDKLIGFQMFAVPPRGGRATSPIMSKEIPASAPSHICLLTRVSHQFDRAGSIIDPVNDRHWAQRNLAAVVAQPGLPIKFIFTAGNPLKMDARFLLVVNPVSEERLWLIANELRMKPIDFEGLVELEDTDTGEFMEGGKPLEINLVAGEQRKINLHIHSLVEIGKGQFMAVDIVQINEETKNVIGGLGITIRGEDG